MRIERDNMKPYNEMNYTLTPEKVTYDRDDSIIVDICNPDDKVYHDHLYVIGNEYGPLCAVYADHEEDALNNAVDETGLPGLRVSEEYAIEMEGEGIMYLGNASEPFDSVYAWIDEVKQ